MFPRTPLAIAVALAAAATGTIEAQPPKPAAIVVTASSHSARPGDLVVLTIATRVRAASIRARAFDRELFPFADGARRWRVLIGIDLETAPGTYVVSIEAGDSPGAEGTAYDLTV